MRAPRRSLKRVLFGTVPASLIVIGLAIKAAILALGAALASMPLLTSIVDTAAGAMIAIGGATLLYRGLASAKRRLLWRVRRRLIISYIFIGFVPAVLIIAFFLLAGLSLFSNFGAYLLQVRLRTVTEDAQSIAEETALEIQRGGDLLAMLSARQGAAAREFPGLSMAVVPVETSCTGARATTADREPGRVAESMTAGPWTHVDPPRELPPWIACDGYHGLLAYGVDGQALGVVGRAVAWPASPLPLYAVVVDIPVNDAMRDQLEQSTGVRLNGVTVAGDAAAPAAPGGSAARGVAPLAGRSGSPGAARAEGPVASERGGGFAAPPVNAISFLDTRDWSTGATGELVASMQFNVGDVFSRISAAQGTAGQTFAQKFLIALLVVGVLLLIIQAAALGTGLALAKSITGSVHELFVGTERVRKGDFGHKIAVVTDDQLGELARSFNTMTGSIEGLMVEREEKKRLEGELRIAHDIQMSLLPQAALHMAGLSVTATCIPAREVGGDYYDYFVLDDQRLGLLIADVSGKGTSAALYMAELKGLVLSLSRIHTSPRALLIAANHLIAEHLDARSFITITYAVVDLARGTMTYARAGHTPLIYAPGPAAEDRRARILVPDGMVLGLKIDRGEMFERVLEEAAIPIGPGDVFLFFTDGVSEAMNDREDLFGEDRLSALVTEHAHLPSSELRERILREIASFVGQAPQHDDMTMILLKIEGSVVPFRAGEADLAEVGSGRSGPAAGGRTFS